MKKIALLIAISIITLSSVKAQKRTQAQIDSAIDHDPKAQGIKVPKEPKTYTLGLRVDSIGYVNIITALYVAELNLNDSKGPHDQVNQSINLVEQLSKLFASQKHQQDQQEPKKEEKPKTP